MSKELLIQAIQERIVISFEYDGFTRIVEPYVLGYHKGTGNLELRSYRVGGYSKSENEPPWRLFIVQNMRNVRLTDQPALSFRPGYNRNDSHMSRIVIAC